MRNYIQLTFIIFSLIFASTASAQKTEQQLIDACTATANSYPYSRDRVLLEEYGQLFTEDATFQIATQPIVQGRLKIVEALKIRGAQATTRHLSHVVHMEAINNTTAKGISYFNLYRVDTKTMAAGDNSISAPFIVGEYHDEFRLVDNQCLISKRKAVIIFKGQL